MDTGKQHLQGIPVMDPRGATPSTSVPMAARPSGLGGVTLALVDNTKINAGNLLDRLASLLEAEARPRPHRPVLQARRHPARPPGLGQTDNRGVRRSSPRHRGLRLLQPVQFARRYRIGDERHPGSRNNYRGVRGSRQDHRPHERHTGLSLRQGGPSHR